MRREWTYAIGARIGKVSLFFVLTAAAIGQVENVPVNNQVYEFLDRMGVKGVLPLYSNTMIPLSRQEVAEQLKKIADQRGQLTVAEQDFLSRFEIEFAHELNPAGEEEAVVLLQGRHTDDLFSRDREKYLYAYSDSAVSLYVDLLGTVDYRRITGDSYGSTDAAFEQHGGRLRGTIKNALGYYLQGTNGTFFGDKTFALSDPRLRGNVKFKDLNSPYFDYTEAYLRANFDWIGIQFGREYTLIGAGYSDRLILSDNAPVMDFLKVTAHYKSVRFLFLQGSLVPDSSVFPGTIVQEPAGVNKYLALHRLQFSLFDRLNVGASEMIIYQRFSPDFAYLNPVNFYKSAEHSLRDRDNAFLNFDLELFPAHGYKLYGTWLIDDIDFSKIGTGWWGNEFGWQGGGYVAQPAGIPNLDLLLEYTRLEPYVYSNRTAGDDYTNNNIGLGHHLEPNSDEWLVQVGFRPNSRLRTWLSYVRTRHGANLVENGAVTRNVGGDWLEGHRTGDSETATFLDGNLEQSHRLQARLFYEPILNFSIAGTYEFRRSTLAQSSAALVDHYASLRFQVEY